jgi:hypothetical protein
MNMKKEKAPEKISSKEFEINVDDLRSKSRQIASESVVKIDPKDFQKSIEDLQNSTSRIMSESRQKMKKFQI